MKPNKNLGLIIYSIHSTDILLTAKTIIYLVLLIGSKAAHSKNGKQTAEFQNRGRIKITVPKGDPVTG